MHPFLFLDQSQPMKKLLPFSIACLVIAIAGIMNAPDTHSRPEGAPVQASGAPADNNRTCATSGCHSGTASDRDNLIASTVPSTGYIPGETYTMTVSITEAGISRWGFQATAQNSSGDLQGSYVLTNTQQTRNSSGTGGIKYVTHTEAGNSGSTGSKTWSFDWTAPDAGTGTVNFYTAVMASNNNGGTAGDLVYKDQLVLEEDLTASAASISTALSFSVFPNPSSGQEIVVTASKSSQPSRLVVYNALGGIVKSETFNSAQHKVDVSKIPAGLYFIWLDQAGEKSMKRFIKQ
jgi:hypothetical protein